ncbi:MAG: hypothetical protein Q7S33_03635 [Nanoarchaeota archaeon]|nr:hypothetical protein [Nanoarchaeota archaeon]
MNMKSTIKYKIVNKKRRPLCDYYGTCKNLAFKEVYPDLGKKKKGDAGWSYLCRKHLMQELKRLKGKLPYCNIN